MPHTNGYLVKDQSGRFRGPDESRTSPQIWSMPSTLADSELQNITRSKYQTYREMRYDPTIAFARMLVTSPLVVAGWAYDEKDNAPPGAMSFIREMLEPQRVRFVKSAIEGYIDFGWSPFETLYRVNPQTLMHEMYRFKSLLQEWTLILVDRDDGDYIGLRQYKEGREVDLSKYETLLCTFDVEGTYWYGTALMENARFPWCSWNVVEDSSNRYDKKIAGSHWLVYYPVGESPYNGEIKPNDEIAKLLLDSLESSGKIAVPGSVKQFLQDQDEFKEEDSGWKVDLISDKGTTSASFTLRQKYLDSLKVRGFGIPERAILEGQFGTKAESEAQADFAIVNIEMRHLLITNSVNQQVINRIMLLNYGPEFVGSVFVHPVPLGEDAKLWLRKFYERLLSNNDVVLDEMEQIDFNSFRDELGVPSLNADAKV